MPRHPPDALILTLDRKTRRLQGEAPQSKISHEDTLHSPEAPKPDRLVPGVETLRILPLHLVKDRCPRGLHHRAQTFELLPIRRHIHTKGGGGERDRTADLLLAKQALSQLSYTPAFQADS